MTSAQTPSASTRMPRAYNAADVEQRIYQDWLDKDYFHAVQRAGRQPYVIIMPPPNVTGELHLGHALEKALEDALIRYRRMTGIPTLWLPGTDHAGIATQWVVERQLIEEGTSRHDIGREAFIQRVWEHVEKSGGIIHEQSRRLGISADWERHKFTLDSGPSNAVRTTFVSLYEKGPHLPSRTHHQPLRSLRHCPLRPGSGLPGRRWAALPHTLPA